MYTYQTQYYVTYAIACGLLIAGLTIVLHWAGDVFLEDSFREQPHLVRAVGRLLDIGFYLVSVGYVAVTFRSYQPYNTWGTVADVVATKLGIFLIVLGVLHVFNLLVLAIFRGRRNGAPAPAAG
jgi:hypothetical protein